MSYFARRVDVLNSPATLFGYDYWAIVCGAALSIIGFIFFEMFGLFIGGIVGFSCGLILSPKIHSGKIAGNLYWYLPSKLFFYKAPDSSDRLLK